jgi:hypothetical protein
MKKLLDNKATAQETFQLNLIVKLFSPAPHPRTGRSFPHPVSSESTTKSDSNTQKERCAEPPTG